MKRFLSDPFFSVYASGSGMASELVDDNCVSFTVKLSRDADVNVLRASFRLLVEKDAYGTGLDKSKKIYLMDTSSSGKITLSDGTEVAQLKVDEITTLRFVVDFNTCEIRVYKENGEIVSAALAIPDGLGITTGAQLKNCISGKLFDMYVGSSNGKSTSTLLIYGIKAETTDVFAN